MRMSRKDDNEMKLFSIFKIYRYPAYIKMLWYRYWLPYKISRKGIRLQGRVYFLGWPIINLAPDSTIEIDTDSNLCSLSQYTALGVSHPVIIRTLRAGALVKIGKGVRMSGTTICATKRIVIGNNVCIGANVTIVDTDFHSLDPNIRKSPMDAKEASVSAVEIEEDVFIGAGCFILKGVRIGRGSIVGAGSVVTKSCPAFSVIAGNPAVPINSVYHQP